MRNTLVSRFLGYRLINTSMDPVKREETKGSGTIETQLGEPIGSIVSGKIGSPGGEFEGEVYDVGYGDDDTTAVVDKAAERRLCRKLDVRLMPMMAILCMCFPPLRRVTGMC